jgi:filamentous hemagglutinin family protein
MFFRRLLLTTSCLTALVFASVNAYANPAGGVVTGGQANISQSGTTLDVTQTSNRAVINWQTFNIASNETTDFIQPSSNAIVVNRIGDVNPSQILGRLTANGNVVLINPNGVLFGPGSVVDVNGLVATTADLDTKRFMHGGKLHFNKPGNPNASIINEGMITAQQAGLVGLVAPNVLNSGIISANLGRVQLASGDTTTVDFYGDKLLEVAVSDKVKSQLVANTGLLQAEGGTIALTAAAGRTIVHSLIDVAGELSAPAVAQHGGDIYIYAEGSNAVKGNVATNKGKRAGSSTVEVSGTLDASGYQTGQTGGTISVLGDNVGILSGALIDASGDAGGGTIRIGGDFHGQGTTPTALNTYVDSNSLIMANANTTGNGGNVTVWSDGNTWFGGNILAEGGLQSGNGGFVETSGKVILNMQGSVGASAPKGSAGTWLMDPEDVNITTSDSDITGNPSFVTGGDQATASLNVSDITTALNGGTNVTVTTSNNAQSGPNGGSITVSSPITATGSGSLLLSAYNNILVNAAITTNDGNITLDAANSGNNIGSIIVAANLISNGGNITLGGGTLSGGLPTGSATGTYGIEVTGTLNAAGGNISLTGTGTNRGVFLSSATIETSGSGAITVNGSNNSTGYGIDSESSLTQTTGTGAGNGNITFNGSVSSGGSGSNYGIELNTGPYGVLTVSSVDGNIVLNGTAGTSTGGNSTGILDYELVKSTGNGAITLNGTGGSAAGSSYGLEIIGGSSAMPLTVTNNGAISLIGSASEYGIYSVDALTATTNNAITIETDSINFGSGLFFNAGTNNITLKPYTSTTTIGVAGGAGTLDIGTGVLGDITAGSSTIGNTADTGAMTVDAMTWGEPLSLVSGSGVITLAGIQAMGTSSLTLQSDTLPTVSATPTGTGMLSILSASAGTTIGINGGAGSLNLSSAYLTSLGTNWTGYVFGNTSDTGAMTVGTSTWSSPITLNNGSGNIIFDGIQTLGTNTLSAVSNSGNVVLNQNDKIVSTANSGTSITLAAGGNFINNDSNDGTAALTPGTGTARWLVYSNASGTDTFGGLNSSNKAVWDTTYGGTISQSGDRYVFAFQPTVTFTSGNISKIYGEDGTAAAAADYTVSGVQAAVSNAYLADTNADAFTGTPTVTSTGSATTATVAGSSYAVTAAVGSLASVGAYALAYSSTGQLTVTARTVTVDPTSGQSKIYGVADPTLAYTTAVATGTTGLVNSDILTGSPSYMGAGQYTSVGTYATTLGDLANSNYNIVLEASPPTFAITVRTVTVDPTSGQSKIYGVADPTLTYATDAATSTTGLVNSDTLTGSPSYTGAGQYTSVGTYTPTTGTLANSNYNIVLEASPPVFTINPVALTITAANESKTAGGVFAFTGNEFTSTGLVNGNTVGIVTLVSSGTASSASAGNYAITASGATGGTFNISDYIITYVNGQLTVTQASAPITQTVIPPTVQIVSQGIVPVVPQTYSLNDAVLPPVSDDSSSNNDVTTTPSVSGFNASPSSQNQSAPQGQHVQGPNDNAHLSPVARFNNSWGGLLTIDPALARQLGYNAETVFNVERKI